MESFFRWTNQELEITFIYLRHVCYYTKWKRNTHIAQCSFSTKNITYTYTHTHRNRHTYTHTCTYAYTCLNGYYSSLHTQHENKITHAHTHTHTHAHTHTLTLKHTHCHNTLTRTYLAIILLLKLSINKVIIFYKVFVRIGNKYFLQPIHVPPPGEYRDNSQSKWRL